MCSRVAVKNYPCQLFLCNFDQNRLKNKKVMQVWILMDAAIGWLVDTLYNFRRIRRTSF